MRRPILLLMLLGLLISVVAHAELARSDITQVVLLGTGTPNVDPERSGPEGPPTAATMTGSRG